METILLPGYDCGICGKTSSDHIFAASEPAIPEADKPELQPQHSAPSYFFSLRENDAPPFLKPGKEPKPKLLIGTIMKEQDAIEMVAEADADKVDGLRKYLSRFLVDKKIIPNYSFYEKAFLINLLRETLDYAAQRDFSELKLSCMINIYLATHLYFKWYYWHSPVAVWSYFKELMITHSIDDTPYSQDVFDPEECYDIVTHFHTVYMMNLPLIHILTFGAYKLKLQWPFKPKH